MSRLDAIRARLDATGPWSVAEQLLVAADDLAALLAVADAAVAFNEWDPDDPLGERFDALMDALDALTEEEHQGVAA